MRTLVLLIGALVQVATLAYAQGNCVMCKRQPDGYVCAGTQNGGCSCDPGQFVCTVCGACANNKCFVNCNFPGASSEEISKYPWLKDADLPAQLKPYSESMAELVEIEQEKLQTHFCTKERQGRYYRLPERAISFESTTTDGMEYRTVGELTSVKERLDIREGDWSLYRENHLLAQGPIISSFLLDQDILSTGMK